MKDENQKTEDRQKRIHDIMRKSPVPEKLETDEHGRLLLDPLNPQHVAWYESDGEYEFNWKDNKDNEK